MLIYALILVHEVIHFYLDGNNAEMKDDAAQLWENLT